MHDCSNFKDISLLSVVGKVYGRVLINPQRQPGNYKSRRKAPAHFPPPPTVFFEWL